MSYLTDKLGSQYRDEIDKVILFSRKISLNYDCLRAIAFELSLGEPFEAVIQDLNILNVHAEYYDLALHCKGGVILRAKSESLDLFNRDKLAYVYLDDDKGNYGVQAVFNPADCTYDMERNAMVLPGNCISFTKDTGEGFPFDCKEGDVPKLIPEYMTVSRTMCQNIHYLTA